MDFDSPEVMKDFPGLYGENRRGNDSDYNDDDEKAIKKEMNMSKRKEKKDKKDKDKGYAALEGESSDEASPSKAKKSKSFKFSKSKEKEKENLKEKAECSSKKKVKRHKKGFSHKFSMEGPTQDLADALPIFGASLEAACQRAKCHDGIPIPLPIRECIDYIEEYGLNFENVYKITGPRNKVFQIKKKYNNRQPVKFTDYDVPTVTSVLKAFLRDLPEPVFTTDLLVRFEEAGAIINYHTRGKHLLSLINSLPQCNLNLLGWIITHLHNVSQREQVNKMSMQNLAQALHHTFHVSSKLLQALISHRDDLFPDRKIVKYFPPLEAGGPYPDDPNIIMVELRKLESALNLIHWEMQQGFFSDGRQDQLWEVQRIQTDLKRKLKKVTLQPDQMVTSENGERKHQTTNKEQKKIECAVEDASQPEQADVEYQDDDKRFFPHILEKQNSTESESIGIIEAYNQEANIDTCEAVLDSSGFDVQQLKIYDDVSSRNLQQNETSLASTNIDLSTSPRYQKLSQGTVEHHQYEAELAPEVTSGIEPQVTEAQINSRSQLDTDDHDERQATETCEPEYIPRQDVKIDNKVACANISRQFLVQRALTEKQVTVHGKNQPVMQGEQQRQLTESSDPEDVQRREYSEEEESCDNIPNKGPNGNKVSDETNLEVNSKGDFDADTALDCFVYENKLLALQHRNDLLIELITEFSKNIDEEKRQIEEYRLKLESVSRSKKYIAPDLPANFKKVRELLIRENQMLEIKKVELTRKIMECREQCLNIEAELRFYKETDVGM